MQGPEPWANTDLPAGGWTWIRSTQPGFQANLVGKNGPKPSAVRMRPEWPASTGGAAGALIESALKC